MAMKTASPLDLLACDNQKVFLNEKREGIRNF